MFLMGYVQENIDKGRGVNGESFRRPYKTGNLYNSIQYLNSRILTEVSYAGFVNYGTNKMEARNFMLDNGGDIGSFTKRNLQSFINDSIANRKAEDIFIGI